MPIGRIGSDFQFNSTTFSLQYNNDVVMLKDGRFVVVFQDVSESGLDTFDNAVRARIFNADGTESVPEFIVNETLIGNQREPSVTALSDGRFVVTYTDATPDNTLPLYSEVRARVFNADGTEFASEFVVNTSTNGFQDQPKVTALAGGRFVITFTDESKTFADTSGTAVHARIFNANGSQVAPQFRVNTVTESRQWESDVQTLPDGRFVVTYTDDSFAGDIRARIFNANGTQSVPEFVVNTTPGPTKGSSVAVLSDGRIVVSYDSFTFGGGSSDFTVKARIFNSNGTQSVPEFQVNTTSTKFQYNSSVAALSDGRFVIAYDDESASAGDLSSTAVRARIFNADGTESVPEFVVNTVTERGQNEPVVAALSDGRFVISFTDDSQILGDTSGSSVRAQIFDPKLFNGTSANETVTGGNLNDRYFGSDGKDNLSGRGGQDSLEGGGGDDVLNGGSGNDTLLGGQGADTLNGGTGKDLFTGGGGLDRFIFSALGDTGTAFAARDVINTFAHGDKIDLTAIDANSRVANDQAFSFIGAAAFSGVAGQLRHDMTNISGTGVKAYTVYGDTNGDRVADFSLQIYTSPTADRTGQPQTWNLASWDFLL